MRAIFVEHSGPAEVLRTAALDTPRHDAEELLVAVASAGVNYRDIYDREGWTRAPFVPGFEGAGEVIEVGSAVSGFAVGDRVGWASARGSYAELIALPAERAIHLPDGIPFDTASAVLLQGVTAHYLCSSACPVQPGEWVLVHAAAGGVGMLLTQLIRRRGGRVIGTVSTPDKAEIARSAGAEHVIGYEGFASAVTSLSDGAGVAAIFDGVGKQTFDEGLDALRARGMLVSYGWASGAVPPLDLARLGPRSLFVTRTSMTSYVRPGAWLQGRAAEIFEWIQSGAVRVHIDGTYDLADAAEAHRRLESRRSAGKLLLRT